MFPSLGVRIYIIKKLLETRKINPTSNPCKLYKSSLQGPTKEELKEFFILQITGPNPTIQPKKSTYIRHPEIHNPCCSKSNVNIMAWSSVPLPSVELMSRKPTEVRGEAGVYIGGGEDQSQQGDAGAEQELGAASWPLVTPRPGYQAFCITSRLRFI